MFYFVRMQWESKQKSFNEKKEFYKKKYIFSLIVSTLTVNIGVLLVFFSIIIYKKLEGAFNYSSENTYITTYYAPDSLLNVINITPPPDLEQEKNQEGISTKSLLKNDTINELKIKKSIDSIKNQTDSSQNKDQPLLTENSKNDDNVLIADQIPEFPGGKPALYMFIRSNILYPIQAVNNQIFGKVLVSFIVDENGTPIEFKIEKGVHPLLDSATIKAIRKMPNWTPGISKGKRVKVLVRVPVIFTKN